MTPIAATHVERIPESTAAGRRLEDLGLGPTTFTEWVVLVTGAARGIGAALAEALAACGARVALVDVRPEGAAVAEQIHARGGSAMFLSCDLTDAAALVVAIEHVEQTLGPITALVNNAVVASFESVPECTLQTWDTILDTNVRAPFIAMRHVLPGMLARRSGVVVNLVSLEGSPPYASAFNASKQGLRSLTLTAAREIAMDAGVSVFAIVPGVVDTEGLRETMIPGFVRTFGGTEAEAVAALSQNPGYDGLMPVSDCAAALAAMLLDAPNLHGQIADPFTVLARGRTAAQPAPEAAPEARPAHLQSLSEVVALNRDLERKVALRTRELAEARARSEALLLNVLPAPIAARLLDDEGVIADHFDDVTVLFADLAGFTVLSASLPPQALVRILDEAFSVFDHIVRVHRLEKIKTIGDCYMLAGGIPTPSEDHTARVATAGLAFIDALAEVGERTGTPLACRIGMHCGPVVAGVIGKHRFIYDLWGHTVNTASRMESHGVVGAIQCTEAVRARLDGRFTFEARGVVDVKGLGPIATHLLRAG